MTVATAAVDLGLNSCRVAFVDLAEDGYHMVGETHQIPGVGSVDELANELVDRLGDVERIAASVPGFVDNQSGEVRLCRVQPWAEGPLEARLRESIPDAQVKIVNDGEAHMRAHLGLLQRGSHPAMTFAFGSAVGFSMTNEAGYIARPRNSSNWDIGSIRINNPTDNDAIWWMLGENGLLDLLSRYAPDEALRRFGHRVGWVVTDFSTLFQPRSVVLTGETVAAHAAIIVTEVEEAIANSLPDEYERPQVIESPFPEHSALIGAATLFG